MAFLSTPLQSLFSKTLIGFFILSFFISPAFAQPTNLMSDPAFQHGEKITYHVFYSVIGMYLNAGTAVFKTTREKFDNNDAYHVVAEGYTNHRYDWIFKVRDRYESYFTVDNFHPLKFVRNIIEGDFTHHEEVTFDNKANIATTGNKKFKVQSGVFDVINAIYYARNLNYNSFAVGDKIPFSMFLDEQVYNMYIRYLGKEKIKTKYGEFNAIKLKPLLIKGSIFDGGENMTLWVTDDPNHIPVRAESPISVGSVKIDMMGYDNLRYPLSSLISQQ
jgi:hypothetical protein